MQSLSALLPVQNMDTKATQLSFQRANLELRSEIATAKDRLEESKAAMESVESELRGIRRLQKEAEDHASMIEERVTSIDKALYDGSVTDRKELESMQTEIAQLRSNQDRFETTALEQMEAADPVEDRLAALGSSIREVERELEELSDRLLVAEAEIDAELEQLSTDRFSAVGSISDELLSLYESFRGLPGGIAVAEMIGNRCGGCHLDIPIAEAEAVRAATEPRSSVCPECGCLLAT